MTPDHPISPSILLDSIKVTEDVPWYHLSDPASPALDQLAAHFGIHPLQVEDCRHRRQTARVEEFDRYTFIVVKALVARHATPAASVPTEETPMSEDSGRNPAAPWPDPSGTHARFEDFDIFVGADYVLTVDEGECSVIPRVAKHISAAKALQTPDRITHALLDAVVDQYLPALDQIGEFINRLEDRVIRRPTPATLREIFRMKRVLLDFRRVATGMREAVNALIRQHDASPLREHDRELRFYYRDVYDHVIRVLDFVETYRDLLTGSLDIYLSAVANRTNEVMKVLTIWGTIALPLLVITGFYGMNVDLPLQKSPHVLLMLGTAMAGSALGIIWYFRRKHWF